MPRPLAYSPATFAVIANDAINCAVARRFRQSTDPPRILWGTTTTSPASSLVCSTLSSDLQPITEPFARITKISFLLAILVGPPERWRYQLASLPGTYVIAVELYTC